MLQTYVTNTADQRSANNIKKLIEFVSQHQYSDELEDDDPFFFLATDDKRCYKSVSCNCVPSIKWALCSHVVAYSNAYSLDIYGKEYRQSNKFVKKN